MIQRSPFNTELSGELIERAIYADGKEICLMADDLGLNTRIDFVMLIKKANMNFYSSEGQY
jgi:hypothetical protein